MTKIFRFIVLILNIFAAIALLMACLCCFINPKIIWWTGFFGLAYMYLLVTNLCFVVFWLLSRKKIFTVISIFTILISWSFLGKHIQIFEKEIPEDKLSESFKIISFNVQGFEQINNIQANGEMLNMFDFFREEDADIICMQEFVVNRRGGMTLSTIEGELKNMPYSHIELTGRTFGIATFSKFPIIRKELVYADMTTNACMCSDIVIGNDTVRVYNIHLKSVGFNIDERHLLDNVTKIEFDRRNLGTVKSIFLNLKNSSLDRANQVQILSSHIAQSPYPVIVCGDFNDPPASFSYRKVRGNLKDAFVEAGSGRSTTYNIGKIASLRIDYILFSDVFDAYNYKSPKVRISDHFPVKTLLSLQRRVHEKLGEEGEPENL